MSREYRQFCGLARALEIVGGRWTLLIVRDLLGGPKRFTELQEGLPGIPTNVLSGRLRDLEEAAIVTRQLLAKGVAYTLTDYGRELDDTLVRLGLWGAKTMGPRRDGEFFSVHSLSLALRGAFHADKAHDGNGEYELRLDHQLLRVSIIDGQASYSSEQSDRPDVIIETDPDTMNQILTGQLSLDKARASGHLQMTGRIRSVRHFFEMFHLAQ
jgi:DNA-binding HxlR family transcriptional regulator/putative sterol carrier protein